jgi:predicted amidohydrolase
MLCSVVHVYIIYSGARRARKREEKRKEKKTNRDQPNRPSNPSKSSRPRGHRPAVSMPSSWEGVKRARGWVRTCGVVEVARDGTAKGEVEREEDSRGERGEIREASLIQDLSGVLSARAVESESAAIARGLDLR